MAANVSTGLKEPALRPPQPEANPGFGLRLALQTVATLVALVLLVLAGALWFRQDLHDAGSWFVGQFGMAGVFFGVLIADSMGVPIPPDTYLAVAVMGGARPLPLLVLASVASVLGGNIGYWIGHNMERWGWVRRRMGRFQPRGEALFRRWGMTSVVIAAWTPVPFSVVCWFAGAFRMPYRRFFLATLHRVPRIALYYYAIMLGWTAGS